MFRLLALGILGLAATAHAQWTVLAPKSAPIGRTVACFTNIKGGGALLSVHQLCASTINEKSCSFKIENHHTVLATFLVVQYVLTCAAVVCACRCQVRWQCGRNAGAYQLFFLEVFLTKRKEILIFCCTCMHFRPAYTALHKTHVKRNCSHSHVPVTHYCYYYV